MRQAILADIHGNLEALESVLGDCHKQGVERYFCAGDIVGYGANPLECIALLKQINCSSVKGNHDLSACDLSISRKFNKYARAAAQWTYKILDDKAKKFLEALPYHLRENSLEMVHGSLLHPEFFHYLLNLSTVEENFKLQKQFICFVGHSHIPEIFEQKEGKIKLLGFKKILLNQQGSHYLVNVGSVGQPRDLDYRAAYCVYDDQNGEIITRRVDYDVEKSVSKIKKAGMPAFLAYRLLVGK